jgi:hypothetical protein
VSNPTLIKFTDAEKRRANETHMDPDAWRCSEEIANLKARASMRKLTQTLLLACQNPEDADAIQLRHVVRSLLEE